MKRFAPILMATLVLAAGCGSSDDPVVGVKAEDAEMNAAILAARDSLTNFVTAFRNPQTNQQHFLVKAKFTKRDVVEHLWVADLVYDGRAFHGVVANEPQSIAGLKFKQPVDVKLEQISDWMFVEDGKLIGGYTSRVLRKRMTPEERRQMDSHLPYRYE